MNLMFFMETNQATYNYLNVVRFQAVTNWSVSYILRNKLLYKPGMKLERIGNLIRRSKVKTTIKDEVLYKRVTVRLYNKGVVQRDKVLGKTIRTKNQYYIKAGQFIMSKIDARNGAFGIVPQELDGAAITQDFLAFDINKKKVLPAFFILLTQSHEFRNLCQKASSGTTGRQRIDEKTFLSFEVPSLELEEQERLVQSYQIKIQISENKEKEAIDIHREIDQILLDRLNLPQIDKSIDRKKFQVFHYKDLIRWDIYSSDITILNGLNNSKYPISLLGTEFRFIRRGWSKKNYKDATFNYIELGGVDPIEGITTFQEVEINNAPSRASQTVREGDLIIGTTRPYLKRIAIIPKKYSGFVCSSGFSVIEVSPKYNLEYLKYYLFSEYGIEQLKNSMTGALYPAITEEKLKELLIPIPPLEVQIEIANMIQKLNDKIVENRMFAQHTREQAIKEFEESIFKTKK